MAPPNKSIFGIIATEKNRYLQDVKRRPWHSQTKITFSQIPLENFPMAYHLRKQGSDSNGMFSNSERRSLCNFIGPKIEANAEFRASLIVGYLLLRGKAVSGVRWRNGSKI